AVLVRSDRLRVQHCVRNRPARRRSRNGGVYAPRHDSDAGCLGGRALRARHDRRSAHHAVRDRAPDCAVQGPGGRSIMALTVLCLSFVLFLILGVPVAFAIGLSCLATFAVEGLPFETAIQMMVSGMNVFSFLAIPFFIFSGELMLHGGIADKIVDFARSLVGHWKGGLGLANVMASTLFGGVSGSPVADTSAMGGVMIPIMKREGYSAAYAVNVTTHASLSGALMPTSH